MMSGAADHQGPVCHRVWTPQLSSHVSPVLCVIYLNDLMFLDAINTQTKSVHLRVRERWFASC